MITQFILDALSNLVQFVFGIFPAIPPLPSVVTDGAVLFMSMIDSAMRLVVYFVGAPLFYFIVATVIFFTFFDFLISVVYRIILQGLILRVLGR